MLLPLPSQIQSSSVWEISRPAILPRQLFPMHLHLALLLAPIETMVWVFRGEARNLEHMLNACKEDCRLWSHRFCITDVWCNLFFNELIRYPSRLCFLGHRPCPILKLSVPDRHRPSPACLAGINEKLFR